MDNLVVEGKLIKILPAQSGTSARGEWTRQEFVIETNEQYPKKICIADFNKRLNIENYQVGSDVRCSINIESREFNEKWYTNVTAWKMELASATAAPTAQTPNSPVFPANQQPFGADNNATASNPGEDLPF